MEQNSLERRLGVALARYRKANGLTQEDIREATGISIPTLRNVETGDAGYTVSTFEAICKALDVSPAGLMITVIQPSELKKPIDEFTLSVWKEFFAVYFGLDKNAFDEKRAKTWRDSKKKWFPRRNRP